VVALADRVRLARVRHELELDVVRAQRPCEEPRLADRDALVFLAVQVSVGVVTRCAYEIGDSSSCRCGPGPSQPALPPSDASNVGRSLSATIIPQSMGPAPTTAARNRAVCVTPHAVM